MKQLEPANRPSTNVVGGNKTSVRQIGGGGGGNIAATTTATAATPTTGTRQQQQPPPPLGGQNASTMTTTTTPNTTQTIAALRARLNQVAVRGPNGHGGTAVTLNPAPGGQQQQPQQQQPRPQPPVITNVTPQSEFEVKPEFRKVLKAVPGVRDDQSVFTYDEVKNICIYHRKSNKKIVFN